eukprot:scaffold17052_cov114-Isochrysis_galbana.AAC.4
MCDVSAERRGHAGESVARNERAERGTRRCESHSEARHEGPLSGYHVRNGAESPERNMIQTQHPPPPVWGLRVGGRGR